MELSPVISRVELLGHLGPGVVEVKGDLDFVLGAAQGLLKDEPILVVTESESDLDDLLLHLLLLLRGLDRGLDGSLSGLLGGSEARLHLGRDKRGSDLEQELLRVLERGSVFVDPSGEVFGEFDHSGLINVIEKAAHLSKSLHSGHLFNGESVKLGYNLDRGLLNGSFLDRGNLDCDLLDRSFLFGSLDDGLDHRVDRLGNDWVRIGLSLSGLDHSLGDHRCLQLGVLRSLIDFLDSSLSWSGSSLSVLSLSDFSQMLKDVISSIVVLLKSELDLFDAHLGVVLDVLADLLGVSEHLARVLIDLLQSITSSVLGLFDARADRIGHEVEDIEGGAKTAALALSTGLQVASVAEELLLLLSDPLELGFFELGRAHLLVVLELPLLLVLAEHVVARLVTHLSVHAIHAPHQLEIESELPYTKQ
mmetsp:Transcript_33929/g.44754  ORF Transcript_33929/g.44754 Transcript_33929/m.44754 type:complete len:420 (+) Transcript_33929:2207-3466(+)